MAETDFRYTSETPAACHMGYPGCDCDRMMDGSISSFCECHDEFLPDQEQEGP